MNLLIVLLRQSAQFHFGNAVVLAKIVVPYLLISLSLSFLLDVLSLGSRLSSIFEALVTVLLYPLLSASLIITTVGLDNDREVNAWESYQESFQYWKQLFSIYIICLFPILVGTILLILPGLYLLSRFSIVEYLSIYHSKFKTDAIKLSWGETKRIQWVIFFGLIVISIIQTVLMGFVDTSNINVENDMIIVLGIIIVQIFIYPFATVFNYHCYKYIKNEALREVDES